MQQQYRWWHETWYYYILLCDKNYSKTILIIFSEKITQFKNVDILGKDIIDLQKNYNATLTQTIDPIVHLVSYISNLKFIINGW